MKKISTNHRYYLYIAIFCLLALGLGFFFAYTLARNLPSPERITDRTIIQSTKIYDRDKKTLLYEIHGEEKRTIISLRDIPQRVVDATLAAEDIHFYTHHGLDWRGIIRAGFKNIIARDIYGQGGSTITQQLVKNSILTGERSYTRKIKEALLALLIETKYSKDEILELYLNQIPYGSNAYGIAAAAQTYFGKQVSTLTLEEIATLTALPKAPSYYSPYGSHKNELVQRSRWVLNRMAQEKFISAPESETAQKITVAFLPPRQSIRAPHFVMYVREYLNTTYGEEFVEQGGLTVITSLDWKLHEEAEKIVAERAAQNEKTVGARNAALVALDPKTGDILAMVGSRDYFDTGNDGNVNVTTRPRQPGSAFKPFVYATAFKKGYTPETVLFDVATEFNLSCNADGTPGPLVKDPTTCYHPQNYDETFRGPVSLRQAIAQSINVPAVKLLYLAGVNDSIKTAQSLGITTLTEPDRYGLSLVLGGAEVTLLEMTSAFGVFAQDGILRPKTAILRIENADGSLLEEKKDTSLPVLDTDVARIINDVLSDNDARIPMFSPVSSLFFPDRDVAAKTGTTQDYRDAWTIGYTPSLAVGVWVGNNDNTPMDQKGLSVMVAGPIWHAIMQTALAGKPPEAFTPPEKQIPEKPIFRGLYRSGPTIKIDTLSGKRAIPSTPTDLIKEISTGAITSILASIDRENPLGPLPQESNRDPQFTNWQTGIDTWLTKNVLPEPVVPHEFDTLHSEANRPILTLLYPHEEDQEITSPPFITVQYTATFPPREISLFIDNELIDSKIAPLTSYIISFPISPLLTEGSHQLTITAYDTMGNRTVKEKNLIISSSP